MPRRGGERRGPSTTTGSKDIKADGARVTSGTSNSTADDYLTKRPDQWSRNYWQFILQIFIQNDPTHSADERRITFSCSVFNFRFRSTSGKWLKERKNKIKSRTDLLIMQNTPHSLLTDFQLSITKVNHMHESLRVSYRGRFCFKIIKILAYEIPEFRLSLHNSMNFAADMEEL